MPGIVLDMEQCIVHDIAHIPGIKTVNNKIIKQIM